jgi:hypothetical protein
MSHKKETYLLTLTYWKYGVLVTEEIRYETLEECHKHVRSTLGHFKIYDHMHRLLHSGECHNAHGHHSHNQQHHHHDHENHHHHNNDDDDDDWYA